MTLVVVRKDMRCERQSSGNDGVSTACNARHVLSRAILLTRISLGPNVSFSYSRDEAVDPSLIFFVLAHVPKSHDRRDRPHAGWRANMNVCRLQPKLNPARGE